MVLMDFDKNRIERLQRALYSRNENLVPKEKRNPVTAKETNVPENWGSPKSFELQPEEMTRHNNSFFNKFLIGSLVFFVLALAVAAFIFLGGLNMISSNNLDIKVVAPSSISSGEELLMSLSIVNGNRTDLDSVALVVDYPVGAQDVGENNKILTHDRIDLGTIPKGSSKDYSVRALLFGEKDSIKTFIFKLEYRVKGSNAVFSKEKTVDVSIGSSPLIMQVDYPKEVNSGQEVQMSINLTSNSSIPLKNSLVKIEYPYGFTYKSSNIKPIRDNSIWNVGDLKDGEKKNLTVTGVLIGQNMEDRSFRISSGVQTPDSVGEFDSDLAEASITVGIRKSFFDLVVSTSDNNVKSIGEYIPISIKWQNTLPDKILNSRVEATLSGNILDRNSVSIQNSGFYESINNRIVWDKNSMPSLEKLMPGADGQTYFSLSSLTNPIQVRSVRNPHIDVHVVMTGDRSDTDANSISVSSTQDIVIKLQSAMTLTSKSYRSVGPFTNIGPIPPRADKETTYTITWVLTNTTNDLKDAVVTGVLPAGVEWKAETSPSSERISYDADSRTVSWNVGNISAGAGFTLSPETVSFKVGLTPSVNQISASPHLVRKITSSATDTYTNTTVRSNLEGTTIEYSDPTYKTGDNIIIK